MQLFWSTPPEGDIIHISGEEHRHMYKSLRKSAGDMVQCIDGSGVLYECIILEVDKSNARLKVINRQLNPSHWSGKLCVGIAMTKHTERIEWFMEKAIEAGIDAVFFLQTKYTERTHIRQERVWNIVRSAMKQSGNIILPQINFNTTFQEVMQIHAGSKLIATCADLPRIPLSKGIIRGRDHLILIGPEGDFSPDELSLALQSGYQAVELGASRLRTETAGLAVVFGFHFYS